MSRNRFFLSEYDYCFHSVLLYQIERILNFQGLFKFFCRVVVRNFQLDSYYEDYYHIHVHVFRILYSCAVGINSFSILQIFSVIFLDYNAISVFAENWQENLFASFDVQIKFSCDCQGNLPIFEEIQFKTRTAIWKMYQICRSFSYCGNLYRI